MATPAASSWERYRDYVRIDPSAVIAPTAAIKIFTLPDSPRPIIEIGAGSHIFASLVILRPDATIRIGARCQLGASSFVCADRIEIGDDVLMAWGCTLMDNDSHSLAWTERSDDARTFLADYRINPENPLRHKDWSHVSRAPIIIGDRAWIGFNSTILKGVSIGDEGVVGAGSVVTRPVPPASVAAGNPARIVRRFMAATP